MVTPANVPDKETLIKLFMHEASRVFHDRLIDEHDRKWWWGTLGKLIKTRFKMEWSDAFKQNVFCDFINKPSQGYLGSRAPLPFSPPRSFEESTKPGCIATSSANLQGRKCPLGDF